MCVSPTHISRLDQCVLPMTQAFTLDYSMAWWFEARPSTAIFFPPLVHSLCESVSLIEPTACPTVSGGRANEGKNIKLFSTLLSTFIKLQLHVLFGSAKILIFFVAVSIVCLR